MKHIISLGAGVQSSCMALMAAKGEFKDLPPVEGCIFADVQAEPQSVYKWLDWLEAQLPFPVYRVTKGSLTEAQFEEKVHRKKGHTYVKNNLPVFVDNGTGKEGKMWRTCTVDYKIMPILKKLKELAGVKRGCKEVMVTQWIGISTDEAHRMKPAQKPFFKNIWPLIDVGMSRNDCFKWMEANGYPKPPRSSCVYCPYHNNTEWKRLKKEEPEEFQKAVDFEIKLQKVQAEKGMLRGVPYLHRSCVRIGDIDFDGDQIDMFDVEGFGNDCSGMCGV